MSVVCETNVGLGPGVPFFSVVPCSFYLQW